MCLFQLIVIRNDRHLWQMLKASDVLREGGLDGSWRTCESPCTPCKVNQVQIPWRPSSDFGMYRSAGEYNTPTHPALDKKVKTCDSYRLVVLQPESEVSQGLRGGHAERDLGRRDTQGTLGFISTLHHL